MRDSDGGGNLRGDLPTIRGTETGRFKIGGREISWEIREVQNRGGKISWEIREEPLTNFLYHNWPIFLEIATFRA